MKITGMKQPAARAAPSPACDCSRPSALGDMTKYGQIQFCTLCFTPIPTHLDTRPYKKPHHPHGRQG